MSSGMLKAGIDIRGFPGDSVGKDSTCNAGITGDVGLNLGSRRSPGGGPGNPLQYSCLEKLKDKGAWLATVHGVTRSQTRMKQLSRHECMHGYENISTG